MCPHCNGNDYKKNGHYRSKIRCQEQMYWCRPCDRHFTGSLANKFEKKPHLAKAILKLKAKGLSQREIAKALGCARWTVQLQLKKA